MHGTDRGWRECELRHDELGHAPYICAAHKGRIDACVALLAAGANVNALSVDRTNSPLHSAAIAGHRDLCDVLLEAGADVQLLDLLRRTTLQAAAEAGHADVCACLLSAGASLSAVDARGLNPLPCV